MHCIHVSFCIYLLSQKNLFLSSFHQMNVWKMPKHNNKMVDGWVILAKIFQVSWRLPILALFGENHLFSVVWLKVYTDPSSVIQPTQLCCRAPSWWGFPASEKDINHGALKPHKRWIKASNQLQIHCAWFDNSTAWFMYRVFIMSPEHSLLDEQNEMLFD